MKATWIGQGGLFFETAGGSRIMIDPYLSNRMARLRGAAWERLVPADERYLKGQLDVLILTHIHDDHVDTETLDRLIPVQKNPIAILAPQSVWAFVRERYTGAHNYILFDHETEVTLKDAAFCSVYAAHSDEHAVGVVLTADARTVYVTGDTLYSRRILRAIDRPVDYMFTVINGAGNNMNASDAARLAKAIAPQHAIPIHWDMFRDFGSDPEEFLCYMQDSAVHAFLMEHFCPITL